MNDDNFDANNLFRSLGYGAEMNALDAKDKIMNQEHMLLGMALINVGGRTNDPAMQLRGQNLYDNACAALVALLTAKETPE